MKATKIILQCGLMIGFGTIYAQSSIKFQEKTHDFGYVLEGIQASHTFKFENNGEDTLLLSEVRPSCGCTTPNWPRQGIVSGDNSEIHVSYNSQGRVGTFDKSIHVASNAKEGDLDLKIKGVVISKNDLPTDSMKLASKSKSASLVFEKSTFNLGKLERSKSSTQEVVVKNTGSSIIKIKSASSGCSCVNIDVNLELLPGQTKSFKVRYTPRDLGMQADRLVLLTDDVFKPVYELVLSADVQETLVIPQNLMENKQNVGFGF